MIYWHTAIGGHKYWKSIIKRVWHECVTISVFIPIRSALFSKALWHAG